jgi:hypothetical protein
MPITDEKIKALLDGTEGVTLGPWAGEFDDGDFCSYIQAAGLFVARSGLAADAAHIARCDPTTIAAICNELLASRAKLKALEETLVGIDAVAIDHGHYESAARTMKEHALTALKPQA